jgi:ABC-2 type transport system permease protein
MGGAYLSIGLFVSSLTENQIIAFILAVFFSFAMLIVGETIVLINTPNIIVPIFAYLGLGAHFANIGRGIIDSRDIIYYCSVIGFFLFLNYLSVESRKWK